MTETLEAMPESVGASRGGKTPPWPHRAPPPCFRAASPQARPAASAASSARPARTAANGTERPVEPGSAGTGSVERGFGRAPVALRRPYRAFRGWERKQAMKRTARCCRSPCAPAWPRAPDGAPQARVDREGSSRRGSRRWCWKRPETGFSTPAEGARIPARSPPFVPSLSAIWRVRRRATPLTVSDGPDADVGNRCRRQAHSASGATKQPIRGGDMTDPKTPGPNAPVSVPRRQIWDLELRRDRTGRLSTRSSPDRTLSAGRGR